MTVLVGVVGVVVALGLCAVMVRDVLHSRTVLTPFEQLNLQLTRQFAVIGRQVGLALRPMVTAYMRAINDTYQWLVDAGLVQAQEVDQ